MLRGAVDFAAEFQATQDAPAARHDEHDGEMASHFPRTWSDKPG